MSSLVLTYPEQIGGQVFPGSLSWSARTHPSRREPASAQLSSQAGDDVLVAAASGGDDRAFRLLVERYQDHVVRTVTGMLGRSQDVDDCVQDVFIRLYGSLARYRGEASIKTYVTRIAINRSLDLLRRRKRSIMQPLDAEYADGIESESPRPDADVITDDERRVLRNALNLLAPKYRAVIVLRLVDGLSTSETADVLGVPYGTVLSRLKRGLGKLKLTLSEDSGLTARYFRSDSADADGHSLNG